MEESNAANGEISEAEDLLLSDAEEASCPGKDITLSIDYNARIVTQEVQCDNEGDDCDMHFVEKNGLLSHSGIETGLHTSTEDLDVSDEEEQSYTALTLQSVNLDGIASTSSENDTNSLSTLNYSRTVFKDEYNTDAEYLSDDEISSNMDEKFISDDKLSMLSPGLTIAGHPSVIKTASSVVLPTTQKALNTFNIKNIFMNSLLLDEGDMHDLYDEQESPPMTCLEFLKSEISDGHTDADNTDAEDISVGSLDDIIESSKSRNPFGKGYNAFNVPVSLSELSSSGNVNDKRHYSGDSRRSSTAEFHTEDETFALENFCDRGKKRVKKRNFILVDKNEKSDDSLTDEEVIEDQ